MTPLISFIITTHNLSAPTVAACLQSILQLSPNPKEREILFIDDGSNICLLPELKSYQDDIIYVRQPQRGLSVARNLGIQMSCGQYIQFVGGGDRLIRAPYEHCLDIMRYHNPDIVYFEETDKEEVDVPFTYSQPMSGSSFMHNHTLRTSAYSYIFARNILLSLRFRQGILNEDEEFTPQLFLRSERLIVTTSKAYYHSTKVKDSASSNKREALLQLSDTEHVIYHLQEVAITLTDKDRAALNRRIAQLTMDYLYDTIVKTHSSHHLEAAITRLHAHGLFPLPDKDYTKRYKMFRKAINSKTGRQIMVTALSYANKASSII